MFNKTVKELSLGLAQGEFSSVELTQHYLDRIKEKDGENDKSSNLNRQNVFRLNLGISKESFLALFGEKPKRPKAGCVIDLPFDFSKLDEIMPHPVYGWMNWIFIWSHLMGNF